MEILKNIDLFITNILDNIGWIAPFLASFLIVIESMVPVLPLCVFITINFYYLGTFLGFVISWIFTLIGCYISFYICRTKFKEVFDKYVDDKNRFRIKKWMKILENLKLEQLVVLLALPFTPAFLLNIAAGLTGMCKKKFITAIIIGKIFLVYFWGFVGTSLLDSLKDPIVLVKTFFIVLIAFLLSKFINKKYNIE